MDEIKLTNDNFTQVENCVVSTKYNKAKIDTKKTILILKKMENGEMVTIIEFKNNVKIVKEKNEFFINFIEDLKMLAYRFIIEKNYIFEDMKFFK